MAIPMLTRSISLPPCWSGWRKPSNPSSPICRHASHGNSPLLSHSRERGASSLPAKARSVRTSSSCSEEKAKSIRSPLPLHHRVAAAHAERLACDEARRVRREEDDGARYVFGTTDPPERVRLRDPCPHLRRAERAIHLGGPHAEPTDFLVSVRHRHPGAHDVEANAVAAYFTRQTLRELDHGRLAGSVDALAELFHAPRVLPQAHNGARLPPDHAVQRGARAIDHAPEIDLDLLLPLVAGLFDEEPVVGPADVVDEHVDPAMARFHCADHGLDTLPLGDVRPDDGRGGSAAMLGLGHHLSTLALVDFSDCEVHALFCKGECD